MQCILCCLRDEMSSHPATSCNFRVVLRDVTLKNITIVELKRRGTRDCMAYFPKCLQRNISVNYFHITRKSFQGSSHVGLVWNSAADSPFGTLSNQVQPSFCSVIGWRRLTEATHNRQACLPPSVSQEHNRATPYSFLKTTKWISILMQQAFSSCCCKY